MAFSAGMIFGIMAMIMWGTADFFVIMSVRKVSVLKIYFWGQLIGAIVLLAMGLFFFKAPSVDYKILGLILLVGVLGSVAYLGFYKGLETGKVAVVSPIAAAWPVLTMLIGIFFLHESIGLLKLIGACLAIVGGITVSFRLHDLVSAKLKNYAPGVPYALIAFIGWGLEFPFLTVLVTKTGWFFPILATRIVGVALLLLYTGIAGKDLSLPMKTRGVIWYVVFIGFLEVFAFLLYSIGVSKEQTIIIAPLVSAFPLITIILARIFLKEKIEINQAVGALCVISGIAMLAL